ncbi:MAG TPA: alpha/beta hydrolase [Mariprofundaceae bacterium]|nr:alpha/beta hydrolase [Mariprofundaceae bacterium]
MTPDPVPGEAAFTHVRPDGMELRGRLLPGGDPLLVFIHGFRSHHRGAKAGAVARLAAARGLGCLRLDQVGHGDSDGRFEDFRVSEAVRDTIAAIRTLDPASVILIGSSLGALIALRITLAGELPIHGLLFIAPACHFISRHPATGDDTVRQQLQQQGFVEAFDPYLQQPYRIPRAMIDDIRSAEPAPGPIVLPCPLRLMHGTADRSIPSSESEDLHRRVAGSTLRLIEGGDHRLDRHIPLMLEELEALLSAVPSGSARTR